MSFSPPFHFLAIGFWLIACYIGPNSRLWESGRIIRFPLCVSHCCNQIGEILMSNTHCSPHYFLSETVLMGDPFWNYCTVSLCCVSLWSPWQFWRVYGTLTAVLWSWQPWIVSVWLTGALGVVLSLISCLFVSLQGSFVACMTATLRQMDDYHYAHLISTFGKMRTDVVVSSMPTKTLRNSLHPHKDISQTDISVVNPWHQC